ncbi:MAG TPA: hypothetical protein VGD63_10570 [Steroidobacteraceae bacterium]
MADEPLAEFAPALDASLDRALAAAFRAPATPSDLRAQVLAAVARDDAFDKGALRRQLENDYRISVAKLNSRYVRHCRDALLGISSIAAAIGFTVRPLSHWLAPFFANSAPIVAGVLALGMGLAVGTILLQYLLDGAGIRRPSALS